MTQMLHTLTVHELADRCGVEHGFIEQLVELGILESHPADRSRFAGELSLRVLRCVRLQHDLGLNLEGVALVLELLDRIEQLERELASLRAH